MNELEDNALEKACRLCLTTEATHSSIFSVPDVSLPFVDKIKKYISIQISENDKLPTLVCNICIEKINDWHTYKENCIKSQEILNKCFEKENATIPMVSVKVKSFEEMKDNASPKPVEDNTSESFPDHNEKAMEVDNASSTEEIVTPMEAVEAELAENPEENPEENPNSVSSDLSANVQIKSEPIDSEDSAHTEELLLNPMAGDISNDENNDNETEKNSNEGSSVLKKAIKKKLRRGPHTHFRGVKVFKKKCTHCTVVLHSKHAYIQHMAKLHGIVKSLDTKNFAQYSSEPVESEPDTQKSKTFEVLNNVELAKSTIDSDEVKYENMIKTEPLTTAQKNLISQLKTYTCYLCSITFTDRVQTVSHVRSHMPDLQPHTCIACSTEFISKSVYRLHCGASFECAMKIALVVPTIGAEKYFTCNMCLLNLENRKSLLSHLAGHANKQYQQFTSVSTPKAQDTTDSLPVSKRSISSNVHGPYMNGSPLHNHKCNLCGMIYRYRPNMIKHVEICKTIPDNIRTSYRCVHCSMTFLVFQKFQTHLHCEHKKREIICFTCHERFTSSDQYLAHHETHRSSTGNAVEDEFDNPDFQDSTVESESFNESSLTTENSKKVYPCTLCGKTCSNKTELSQHLSSHLKVKIYSCVICQTKFSSSTDLEQHMRSHGIHDNITEKNNDSSDMEYSQNDSTYDNPAMLNSSVKFYHCYECGKNFSNSANLSRHKKNIHANKRKRWSCDQCRRRFKSMVEYNGHQCGQPVNKHPASFFNANAMSSPGELLISPATGKPMMRCPGCPRTFSYVANLMQHCQTVHKETVTNLDQIPLVTVQPGSVSTAQRRSAPSTTKSLGYQCDLCDKSFREEQSLKTHRGWHMRANNKLPLKVRHPASFAPAVSTVVHSTDNKDMQVDYTTADNNTPSLVAKPAKARKSFANNPSQRQLNVISNSSPAQHQMKSEQTSWQCQVCDNCFSSVSDLRSHVWEVHCSGSKLEKSASNNLNCETCSMKFADNESLQRHMFLHEQNSISITEKTLPELVPLRKNFQCDKCGKYYSNRKVFLRHKKMHKVFPSTMNLQSLLHKRPYCVPCKKPFSTDASLRRHKISQLHYATARTGVVVHQPSEVFVPKQVKSEPGIDVPPNAFTKKKPVTCHICETVFPNMSVLYQHKQLVHRVLPKEFPTQPSDEREEEYQQMEPSINARGQFSCNVCGKEFPGLANLKLHFAHKHRNRQSFTCHAPGCKLTFASMGALKLHEPMHSNLMYTCLLCPRHVFSKAQIIRHLLDEHNVTNQPGSNKNYIENDLASFTIKNCQGTICPKCKIKYPNLRALKIHYLKFHEKIVVKN